MKVKRILLILLLLAAGGLEQLPAQSMIVRLTDGTSHQFTLSTVEKLTLPENELLVWLTSGTSETYPLESVRKICFDASIGLAENLSQASGNLRVYPNPASKAITVTGIPAGAGAVRIFSMDGRLMASEPVTTDKTTMDISRLQSGLYLLKALGLTTKLVRL